MVGTIRGLFNHDLAAWVKICNGGVAYLSVFETPTPAMAPVTIIYSSARYR